MAQPPPDIPTPVSPLAAATSQNLRNALNSPDANDTATSEALMSALAATSFSREPAKLGPPARASKKVP
jgi:hypothetical protein